MHSETSRSPRIQKYTPFSLLHRKHCSLLHSTHLYMTLYGYMVYSCIFKAWPVIGAQCTINVTLKVKTIIGIECAL